MADGDISFLEGIIDTLPPETRGIIRQIAADISGKPAETFTDTTAAEYLYYDIFAQYHANQTIEENFNAIEARLQDAGLAEESKKWYSLTNEQRALILHAGAQGFPAFISYIAFLTTHQKPQPRDIQEIAKDADALQDGAKAILKAAAIAVKEISEFLKSEVYQNLKANAAAISEYLTKHREEIEAGLKDLKEVEQKIRDLAPFIQLELDREPTGYTLQDVLDAADYDDDGNIVAEGPIGEIIARAQARQAEYETAEETLTEIEQAAEELPRIMSNPTDLLTYPLDKPNSIIWTLLAEADPNGQFELIPISTNKKQPDAVVYYNISFDESEPGLKLTKQLGAFDKRVYIAAAALFNGGNDIISATQIYKMMGNSGNPKTKDVQKINDSLTKMGAARVYLDSTQEVQINKKYTRFKYDSSLLPFERVSAYINNTLTDSAIHLFREPPLMEFARKRGQITSVTQQLLESPISKTEANLRLEDYLLERIGHMKNPKSRAPRKMLLSTIYNKCGIATRNQRSRAPEKIQRYLDHYKKCGWIADYTMDKDSITIMI